MPDQAAAARSLLSLLSGQKRDVGRTVLLSGPWAVARPTCGTRRWLHTWAVQPSTYQRSEPRERGTSKLDSSRS
jgi:hypothetical protein